MKRILCLLLLSLCTFSVVMAQSDALAPEGVPGEYIYAPFPVAIKLDGDTKDWAGVLVQTIDKGTQLPKDDKNGPAQVSVAADEKNLYVLMTVVDEKIITGQHDVNYWNEDSMEFYVNQSGDLAPLAYADGIFQVNIHPGNIGQTDPAKVSVTGVNADQSQIQAIVFKTDNGWGFEAAVPLKAAPAHGGEIGFQAQVNGATTADRDIKLIWSKYDTADISWQNPALFGSAIFFKVGETDMPTPAPKVIPTAAPTQAPVVEGPQVSVNQTGYFPGGKKIAALASDKSGQLDWTLKDASTGSEVTSGKTLDAVDDAVSEQKVHLVDFSEFNTPGKYQLVVDGIESASFDIANDIYSQLKTDALLYFYRNRSGIELTPQLAGEQWARPAGHLSDSKVTCFKGKDADGKEWSGCDYTIDASKGWYDAGDYGKYVVNGGITVWTLLNLYERNHKLNKQAFGDKSLTVPEGENKIPDILDEVRWEMEFILNMQVPEGEEFAGMAFHKMHDLQWAGLPILPPTDYDNNIDFSKSGSGRYAYEPTTAATLNLAATAAQCARIWKDLDSAFSARCLKAAETAWKAAQDNPDVLAGRVPGAGGGDYGDNEVNDEFYWAAAELFITTSKDEYRTALIDSSYFTTFPGLMNGKSSAMYWGDTAALGTISLLTATNKLTEAEIKALADQVIQTADKYLSEIEKQGYRVPIPAEGYVWGSNSGVLNNALVMAVAYDLTGKREYMDGVTQSMNYVLGLNALNKSFVAGYGKNPAQHVHHRFWANKPESGYPPPPPGALAGGVNATADDPGATKAALKDKPIAMRYTDDIDSYSTNEVAINWNAPLTWVATFLDLEFNK